MLVVVILIIAGTTTALAVHYARKHSEANARNSELSSQLAASQKELEVMLRVQEQEKERWKNDSEVQEKRLREMASELVHAGHRILREEHQEQLQTLLNPFRERLQSFEKEIREHKVSGVEQFAMMETLVKTLSAQHTEMNASARSLAEALKGEQKTQGNWGELALERIFELSGLREGVEYSRQTTIRTEENIVLRPDFIVMLPGEKHLVIDSKVSLTAFERFINSSDDLERKEQLKLHIASLQAHIRQLGSKNYADLPGLRTPEFVLMFLPLESSFALAIQSEPELYVRAWEKRVVLVTPSTLLATLKTIESIWKQERQTLNAEKIAEEAGKLYDKFVGFVDDLRAVEKYQQQAQKSFDEAFNKLREGKGNIVRRVEILKELGAKTSKRLGTTGERDDLGLE